MGLTEILEKIYRLMQGLYSESGLRSFFSSVTGWFQGRTSGNAMKTMLVTVAIIVFVGFCIDQVLYWTREDQKEKLIHFWEKVRALFSRRSA